MSMRLLLLCCVGAAVAAPCYPQQTKYTANYHWSPRKIAVPVPQREIVVSLSDLPAGADWVVGVQVRPRADVQVIVGDVHFVGPDSAKSIPVRHVSTIEDWPGERIQVLPGTVRVSSLASLAGTLLVFMQAPSGTKVSVMANGGTAVVATPATSLLVRRGDILPNEVSGPHTLLTLLSGGGRPLPAADVIRTGSGQYMASGAGLRSHVASFQKPSFPAGALVPSGGARVLLKVMIDQSGSVVAITTVDGSDPFLASARDAVRQWKFRPFVADGVSVSVNATVPIVFTQNGDVLSPLTPNGSSGVPGACCSGPGTPP